MGTKLKKFIGICLGVGIAFGLNPVVSKPRPGKKASPLYNIYVGFLAQGPCEPLKQRGYFKKFSFDSAFRNVRFVFGDMPVKGREKTRHLAWYMSSDKSEQAPEQYRALLAVGGEGKIDYHELCPYWTIGSDKKKLTVTPGDAETEFAPILKVVESDRSPDRPLLNSSDSGGTKSSFNEPGEEPDVGLVSLLYFVTFQAGFSRHPPYITWTLERSGEGRLREFKFSLALPFGRLLKGKEVSLEFPFKHIDVAAEGKLTVRFIPVGKK